MLMGELFLPFFLPANADAAIGRGDSRLRFEGMCVGKWGRVRTFNV